MPVRGVEGLSLGGAVLLCFIVDLATTFLLSKFAIRFTEGVRGGV